MLLRNAGRVLLSDLQAVLWEVLLLLVVCLQLDACSRSLGHAMRQTSP